MGVSCLRTLEILSTCCNYLRKMILIFFARIVSRYTIVWGIKIYPCVLSCLRTLSLRIVGNSFADQIVCGIKICPLRVKLFAYWKPRPNCLRSEVVSTCYKLFAWNYFWFFLFCQYMVGCYTIVCGRKIYFVLLVVSIKTSYRPNSGLIRKTPSRMIYPRVFISW